MVNYKAKTVYQYQYHLSIMLSIIISVDYHSDLSESSRIFSTEHRWKNRKWRAFPHNSFILHLHLQTLHWVDGIYICIIRISTFIILIDDINLTYVETEVNLLIVNGMVAWLWGAYSALPCRLPWNTVKSQLNFFGFSKTLHKNISLLFDI